MSNRTREDHQVDHEVIINRRNLLEALRSGQHRQCTMNIGDFPNLRAPVCFYGLVLRLNLPASLCTVWEEKDWAAVYGITETEFLTLVRLNDFGYNFPRLATELEKVFNT